MAPSTLPLLVLGLLLGAPSVAGLAPTGAFEHADVGTRASFALFPDHETVLEGLEAHAGHPWVELVEVGASVEGRPILLAVVTDPESPVPLEDRAVTFLFSQQHGNEPAGTPAALSVLEEIVEGGPLAETLSNQVLLLLPMANPDGALTEARHNAQDLDINRDHIALTSPEAQALHTVLVRYDAHVALDHHEYSGIGLGNPAPVRIYDADLTALFPVHGNVVGSTDDAARLLLYEALWPAAEEAGYSVNEYGELTAAGLPVTQLAGGPDPGIARNHLGLHHVAGLLIETRVDLHPNPFHDAERRIAIHRTVMEATLDYVHAHAERFVEAKRAAQTGAVAVPWTVYREGETRAPLADGYRIPFDPAVEETLARHGLPAPIREGSDAVHDLRHALRGHAAAALHPASSRVLVEGAEGVTLGAGDVLEANETPPVAEGIPGVGALGLVLGLAGAAFLRRWPSKW